MAKLIINVSEEASRKVEERPDIDWEDIFTNCIDMVLDVLPQCELRPGNAHSAASPSLPIRSVRRH